jgi:hypothetical protein
MNEEPSYPKCLLCDQDSSTIPLLSLEYQGRRLWICPQHLPVLIHDPTQLTGKLAGAAHMKPADHKD